MEQVKKKIDFTEGRVFFKILLFILPIVATNLLQSLYNAADMMVVSLSVDGQNAVGAIGTTASFIHLIVNVFIGFAVGANIVVAREIGAKDGEKTQNAVHTALIMAAVFGVSGMLIGISFARLIMQAIGNTGRLLTLSVRYTRLYFAGVPFLSMTNFLMAIFRARGDAKTPLVVLTVSGLLNVGMNFFFVTVCRMSVEGVAIATALSNVASTVILMIKLSKNKDDTAFSWKKLRVDRGAFRDIVSNGVPAGIQGALFSLSNMVIQSSIVRMNGILAGGMEDTPIVNGNAAAMNLEGFIYTAMNAVYQGAITVTSQNVGAKKPQRTYKILFSCLLIVTIIGMGLATLFYLCRVPLLSLYGVKDGAEGSMEAWSTYAGVTRMRYICFTYYLCGIMDVCSGVLRGLGKAMTSMIISLLGACLFRLVWIWTVFPSVLTLDCIFISYPVSWICTAAVDFIFIFRVLKKKINGSKPNAMETKNEE